jgi:ribose/xylose/arabinose/galactoside ABC-type transport system permease subunit
MYAIGSNERAASLTGTNVNNYKILAYMISGVLAADRRHAAGRASWAAATLLQAPTCCWMRWLRP